MSELTKSVLEQTYCNPISVPLPTTINGKPSRRGTASLADPTVFRHGGKYYLYATGGAAWVSDDLVHWEHRPIELPGRGPVGPSIIECKGKFYFIDNNAVMFRSDAPLGPWQDLGRVKDEAGNEMHWADWMLFADDDGTMYAYHNSDKGIGRDGIFVTALDPKFDFARTIGPTINCFAYDPSHVWERRGDRNEDASTSWLEAGWMTKHQGKYYLQYSAPGTEYKTYAVGVYVGDGPMGPFRYCANSPILVDRGGLLNGPGHHAVIEGPDGRLWMVYHVLMHITSKWDRRLAIDPISFNAQGEMCVGGPSETPQWGPLAKRHGAVGLRALSIGRPVTTSAPAGATSATAPATATGAACAVDNNVRTAWEPTGALPCWLSVDLGEVHTVCAARTLFINTGPYQYRIETSTDGAAWHTLADKTANALANHNEYDVADPVEARFVRLVLTGKPADMPLRVIEFTVFGE
jgi:hypothetical protein